MPPFILNKRAVINPINNDRLSFKWAILAKHVSTGTSKYVGDHFLSEEYRYNFSGLDFPTPLGDVKIFEKNNPDVSVNVYGLIKYAKKQSKHPVDKVVPLKVCDEEKRNHFDILLMSDNENLHYCFISNFSRLVSAQRTAHAHRVLCCKRCFTGFDLAPRKTKLSGQEALDQHKLICGLHKPILPEMPKENTMLRFEGWRNTQRHPFVFYADFEAILPKCHEKKGENTYAIHSHEPMSYGISVVTSNDVPVELLERFDIPQSPIIYRGSESHSSVAKHFIQTLVKISLNIAKLMKTNVSIKMTEDDRRMHDGATHCNLCSTVFTVQNHKTADHCHLSGKYRQTLCNTCNLKLQMPSFVPCFFHNLTSYDSHFIVKELGYDTKTITVIPNSEEKFISFSKYITNDFTIRFIDSIRFMASSLASLAENLITPDLAKFRETSKHFDVSAMRLVTRKGVYPYEYTDCWDKLNDTQLTSKESFYSSLTESHINDDDYAHAKKVWNHFNCKTLGEYSDLYLLIDVLLLSDVFENFRDICISTYNLDPVYYYTAPGFSFDCMLKYTGMKLELLSDYEMLLMFEKGKFKSIKA